MGNSDPDTSIPLTGSGPTAQAAPRRLQATPPALRWPKTEATQGWESQTKPNFQERPRDTATSNSRTLLTKESPRDSQHEVWARRCTAAGTESGPEAAEGQQEPPVLRTLGVQPKAHGEPADFREWPLRSSWGRRRPRATHQTTPNNKYSKETLFPTWSSTRHPTAKGGQTLGHSWSLNSACPHALRSHRDPRGTYPRAAGQLQEI